MRNQENRLAACAAGKLHVSVHHLRPSVACKAMKPGNQQKASLFSLVCFPLTAFRVLKIDLEYYRLWVVSKFFAKDIEATHIQCIGFDAQTNLNVWFLCEL